MLYRAISPAKVNLYLKIKGKTTKKHLLESLILKLDSLADTVLIQKADKNIYCDIIYEGKNLNINNNIVIQASHELQRYASKIGIKTDLGYYIRIEKKIPIGAGLGGASSNAATVLKLLNNIWNLKLNDNLLMKIASKIGSDVPLFIKNDKFLIIEGTGEKVKTLPNIKKIQQQLSGKYLILIKPKCELLTKDVFSFFATNSMSINQQKLHTSKVHNYQLPLSHKIKFSTDFLHFKNDLENAASMLCPTIKEILRYLQMQPGILLARMTGSGSTCFGIFDCYHNAISTIDEANIKSYGKLWSHYEKL